MKVVVRAPYGKSTPYQEAATNRFPTYRLLTFRTFSRLKAVPSFPKRQLTGIIRVNAMNAKLAKDFELPVHSPKMKAPWRAIGLVSAFGFSAVAWAGLYALVQYLL
jgi:hypothetical protein